MVSISERVRQCGFELPPAAKAVANYVGVQRAGSMLIVSGQLPFLADKSLYACGILGDTVSLEDGVRAAQHCALNIIAQVAGSVDDDLSRVVQIVRLGGFVAATPQFQDHPKVVNGASDLMVAVFGDRGRHARAAVGVASLPMGASVEIEASVLVE